MEKFENEIEQSGGDFILESSTHGVQTEGSEFVNSFSTHSSKDLVEVPNISKIECKLISDSVKCESKTTQVDTDSNLSESNLDVKMENDVCDDFESNFFYPMESEQDQNQPSSIDSAEIKLEKDEEEDISLNSTGHTSCTDGNLVACHKTEAEGNLKDCWVYVGPRIDEVMNNLWEQSETKRMSTAPNNDTRTDSEVKDDVNYIMRIQPGDELEKLSECHVVVNSNDGLVDQSTQYSGSDFGLSGQVKKHTGRRPDERRRYICGICGNSFTVSHQLRIHMRIHTGEKPYKCTLCDKAFIVSSHLTIHMRGHTGERPYKCNMCDMAFTQKCNLEQHMRHHEGKKMFECSVCDKRYTRLSHLTKHMTLHTGEKPHHCTICEKAYTRECHLERHMRHHTGERPHQCALCPKAFFESYHLTQHMKVHTGDKSHQPSVPDTRKTLLQFRYL